MAAVKMNPPSRGETDALRTPVLNAPVFSGQGLLQKVWFTYSCFKGRSESENSFLRRYTAIFLSGEHNELPGGLGA